MQSSRFIALVVCGVLGSATLLGCGNKTEQSATGSAATPGAAQAPTAVSAPPQAQTAAQRGMAQGRADGAAYAERMKAQAGTAPKQ